MKEETRKWLAKAASDLQVAKDMIKLRKYTYAAFWCQQSSEKAFKALQIERHGRFDKIHDLVILSGKLKAPDEISEKCKKMTHAYTYARYPDADATSGNMMEISKNFVRDAEEILRWTRKNI